MSCHHLLDLDCQISTSWGRGREEGDCCNVTRTGRSMYHHMNRHNITVFSPYEMFQAVP